MTGLDREENGDVEVELKLLDEPACFMGFAEQSYERQMGEG